MYRVAAALPLVCVVSAAQAQPAGDDVARLQAEIEAERRAIADQRRTLDAQEARLRALEDRLLGELRGTGQAGAGTGRTQVAQAPAANRAPPADDGGVQTVGEAPKEATAPPPVAVLPEQGGIITEAGRVTLEANLEYARADRNRVIFRGIEVPQSVLVGVFDINESRQDVLTAALAGRLGLSSRLELNARVPFIYRSDKTVLAPIAGSENPPGSGAGTRDRASNDQGLGDVEFGARYQLTNGTGGWPFLIAGISAIAPTGSNPFKVPRDATGQPLKAATGAGFWGLSPSLTVLMPTDPAVLFGSLGYTVNFEERIGRYIGDTLIERVDPGDGPSASAGIGISLNQRTSLSLGYSHQWLFGTDTVVRVIDRTRTPPELTDPITNRTRDLQLGRFMFGVSYRASPSTTINWNVELGATDDATDVRTTLRIPFTFGS
jgi:hypothetical protein